VSKKFDLGIDLPEDYFIPFNFVGASLLKNLMKKCKRISVFDYGFDEFYQPADLWNMNIAREYGGQVTTDLNFIFVKNELENAGLKVRLERQFEFIEKYRNGENLRKKGTKKNEKEIVGDDYFYHLTASS